MHRFKNEFFVSATFDFNLEKQNDNVGELLQKRNSTQPIGLPSCGSVFKNPKNHYAAQLIEDSGLKGFVLEVHAYQRNMQIILLTKIMHHQWTLRILIAHIQETIKVKHNIALETEIIII